MNDSDRPPTVSIIVDNFNYERFLGEAIDSAIGQTYPHTEVVIVDDGSTDGSRDVIARYGNRIVAVLKDNGGQGSAFNAGFRAATGAIVIFLDADDVLFPETAQRVVDAFRANPDVVKVHYRLTCIDEGGAPVGRTEPPTRWPLPAGHLLDDVARYQEPVSPPTSGNAYAASALRGILPVPEEPFRYAADAYVNPLVAVLGPVLPLPAAGGAYRLHGTNDSRPRNLELSTLRVTLARRDLVRKRQRALHRALYGGDLSEAPLRDVAGFRTRLVSLKLDPRTHPYRDRPSMLAIRGVAACFTSSRLRWYERCFIAAWFTILAVAPQGYVQPLAEKYYLAHRRGALLTRLLAVLRAHA